MNINFELYRVFYTVATTGNITRASEELNISQPAISKSIKNLEDQLGGQLFIRTKRGVILTEEGKVFYNYIKQAMDYISGAENKFSDLINLESGNLKIGISTTLAKEFLLPYLKVFHETFPRIDIKIDTNVGSELIKKLRNGSLDIVFMHILDKDYGHDLDITPLKEIHSCFVVGEKYKYLCNKDTTFKELTKYPLILQAKGASGREFIDLYASKNNIELNPSFELASYTLIAEFTKIGLGIGLTTKEYIKKELANNELYEIKIKDKLPTRKIGCVLLNNYPPSSSVKKLIELIKKDKK